MSSLDMHFGDCVSVPDVSDAYYRIALFSDPDKPDAQNFLIQSYSDSSCETQQNAWAQVCVGEGLGGVCVCVCVCVWGGGVGVGGG